MFSTLKRKAGVFQILQFEELRFRDGLVWTVGLAVEINVLALFFTIATFFSSFLSSSSVCFFSFYKLRQNVKTTVSVSYFRSEERDFENFMRAFFGQFPPERERFQGASKPQKRRRKKKH